MIVELTPETYFSCVNKPGPLHVVMHYGATCGPCNQTMPPYEILDQHFLENNFTNIKFYRFHHWEQSYKPFIEENNLKTSGVPTFRYYYMGEKLHEVTSSYNDPNLIKNVIAEVVKGIELTVGEFPIHD